jgi:hypothetical protein
MDELVVERLATWRDNPVAFVRDVFNVEPDEWQKSVLTAFPTHNRICMKASKGVGKSTVEAWCIWNFLLTRPNPKIAVTSVSEANLTDGLWTELAKWYQTSAVLRAGFTFSKTRIESKSNPEVWWCSARTWPKSADSSAQADTLAGLHADYLLFVLDEVGGIPDAVMATAEAGLSTGIETKLLIGGNPTTVDGPLYRICTRERHMWFVQEVNGDPDALDRSPRVDIKWARQQIEKFGKDNPWVLVNVYGKFPPSSLNLLIGPDEISAAMRRTVHEAEVKYAQKKLGVDVARFGDDRTILARRQGLMAFPMDELRNARSFDIAARVMKIKSEWNTDIEFIDDTGGYGAGVVDTLFQSGQTPHGVNFSSRPINNHYYNKRAEMWFEMCEWIKRGGCLPNDPELARELTCATYTFKNGKLIIEDKDQIKSRLGFSPDKADALALTFALPDMSQAGLAVMSLKGEAKHEYNPFEENRI